MNDVTPNHASDQRSIRNIPVPAGRHQYVTPPSEIPPERGRGKRGKRLWLWGIGIIVVCILIGLFVSALFAGATVVVTPRQASVTPPPSLEAALNAPVGALSYQLMTVAANATRTVQSSGSQQVSIPAQGAIIISNNYNTSPQTLIANTRFEAPDGKIYRIHNTVTVPGEKRGAGGLTAGTATAIVYADQSGAGYNRGATTFTIPGFQGTPRYKGFSAQASAVSGGFSGTQPAVSSTDMQNADGQMRQELTQGLQSTITSQMPDNFMVISGTFAMQYGNISATDAGSGNATLTETATATEAIVRQSDLANAIAKSTVTGYGGEAIAFADPAQVHIALSSSTPLTSQTSTVFLNLNGTSTLVWQFDTGKIAQALAGKNKSVFETIIKTFAPAVAKATASLRPFWSSAFPSDPSHITVTEGSN